MNYPRKLGFSMIVRDKRYVPVTVGESCRCPADAAKIVRDALWHSDVEIFMCILLDAQHNAMKVTEISRGTINATLIHPREVFRMAIGVGAYAIILAHNHPSGDTTPSQDDRAVTRQLIAAGSLLTIPVHDHLIISGRDGSYYSFSEKGLM